MAVTLVEFLQYSFPLFFEYPEERPNGMMEVRAICHFTCVYIPKSNYNDQCLSKL